MKSGVEPGDQFGEPGVVVGALFVLVGADVDRRNAGGVSALQSEHVGLVRHDSDHSAVDAAIGAGIENGLQVGAVARNHDDEALLANG